MPSHRRTVRTFAAITGALALVQVGVIRPATAVTPDPSAGLTTTLPARTSSVPQFDEVSGSGQTVVWRQQTAADSVPHGWLAGAGSAPEDLGPLADNADNVPVDVVSVQGGVVAVATSSSPNHDLADRVTLRHLDTGAVDTLPVAYDPFANGPDERYRGQAGDGILVQHAYDSGADGYLQNLLLRTPGAADRTLLSGEEEYQVLHSDAAGALVLVKIAPTWAYRVVYLDFAAGTATTVAAPAAQELPQALEFTPAHVGVVSGATLTEWSRSAPADGPATVTLPTDAARYVSEDTLAWLTWSASGPGEELHAMARDGAAPAEDLDGTSSDVSVGDDGLMRAALYRPDQDAGVQTLRAGRVSPAAGDATPVPAGPARLDAMALSDGTLWTSDDSSRRNGVLLRSGLSVGSAGVSAAAPTRALAYTDGYNHEGLAAFGTKVLVEQGAMDTGTDFQVYDHGAPVGTPLHYSDPTGVGVRGFDGAHVLVSDRTTDRDGTWLLHTFADGEDTRVAGGSELDGGALYSSVRDSAGTGGVIRRTDLSSGAVTTVTTVDCLSDGFQIRGPWILTASCAAGSGTYELFNAGSATRTIVTSPASGISPVLGTGVVYTFTMTADRAGVVLGAQPVDGSPARTLLVIPGGDLYSPRWTVDRYAPWAAWMSTDGVTHIAWAGAPAVASATVPAGFSPNGDRSADTWAPVWRFDRPVAWTLAVTSGGTRVRTLTGFAPDGSVAPAWTGTNTAGAKAAEGRYTWTLTATDTATNRQAAALTGTVALRRTAPAASITAPAVASSASATAVVPVAWKPATAGVTSYDVSWRVATWSKAHGWTLGSAHALRTATSARSLSFGASGLPAVPGPGLTYRFYVRAHDDAGQTGPWSKAVTTGVPVDDRSSLLSYKGTWKSASSASDWNGTERVSAANGATVSFTADGTQLRIVAARGRDGGRFAVVVDGVTVGTVNTYATATARRQVVFTRTLGTTIRTHHAQLRVLTGSAAGRSTVRLDAVMVTR